MSACPMRYFDNSSRLSSDACAEMTKNFENESWSQYSTQSMWPHPTAQSKGTFDEFVSCHRNLRYRDGYGLAPERVDQDSENKFAGAGNKHIRGPERKQLFTRVFTAVPNFGRGSCAPNTESYLLSGGQEARIQYPCGTIAERDFDRYMPFIDDMKTYIRNYSTSIANVDTIGMSSRDEMRRQDAKHVCNIAGSR